MRTYAECCCQAGLMHSPVLAQLALPKVVHGRRPDTSVLMLVFCSTAGELGGRIGAGSDQGPQPAVPHQ